MTSTLTQEGYWASYNIPYFEDIFNMTGLPRHMNISSHDYCPRANIFRRDQGSVTTLEDLEELMRYNDYENDPLSLGMPNFAISARFDLIPIVGTEIGGVDAKVKYNDCSCFTFSR